MSPLEVLFVLGQLQMLFHFAALERAERRASQRGYEQAIYDVEAGPDNPSEWP